MIPCAPVPASQHFIDAQSLFLAASALRVLSADMVEQAASGHPGMPLGMADVVTVLWSQFLRHDPRAPHWLNRDRLVLSSGHGCALLYSALTLLGYALHPHGTLDERPSPLSPPSPRDLSSFRRAYSPYPGHPEYGPGIEATTGPLAQGLANSVGMALARRILSQKIPSLNHYVYAIVGDGCLMEGLSQEAISLAGHWELSNLVVLWDDNDITIDGSTNLARSEAMFQRFQACNWRCRALDGHDYEDISRALSWAKCQTGPVLLACKTRIGRHAPNKEGTAQAHGAPLGSKEVAALREALNWPEEKSFEVPESILTMWRHWGEKWHQERLLWEKTFEETDASKEVYSWQSHQWREKIDACLGDLAPELGKKSMATRSASGCALAALAAFVPFVLGSGDLAESTQVVPLRSAPKSEEVGTSPCPQDLAAHMFAHSAEHPVGRYIYYGVREHAMAAIMNGLSLYGAGFISVGSTFFCFSDYARPAMRLSALMGLPAVYVMTHDSIGLGQDGPTHQPIEHLASFRAMPNMCLLRPCDAIETLEAWRVALFLNDTPSMLVLSRQNLPPGRRNYVPGVSPTSKGVYCFWTNDALQQGNCDATCETMTAQNTPQEEGPALHLWASGSEVALAMETAHLVHARWQKEGHPGFLRIRVLSCPSFFLFHQQDQTYQDLFLQQRGLNVAIEAASSWGWHRYVGPGGLVFCADTFGLSAPAQEAYKHFGLCAEHMAEVILPHIKDSGRVS